jgi:hypothetical protein
MGVGAVEGLGSEYLVGVVGAILWGGKAETIVVLAASMYVGSWAWSN